MQILAIFIGNAGIIYMFRKENKEDLEKVDENNKSLRKEIREDQKHLDNRWYAAIKSIEAECKDFHERMLELERKRK